MRLGIGRLLKLTVGSFFIQTSWSFYSMQAMGFNYAVGLGLDRDRRERFLKQHQPFFNTHPYFAGYVIGAFVRACENDDDPAKIVRFTTIAQTSFASTGDILFWQTIRPAALLIAVLLAVTHGALGPLLFLAVYNLFHLYHRVAGIREGYQRGYDVIYLLRAKRITMPQRGFEMIGAFATGLLLSILSPGGKPWLVIPPFACAFWLALRKAPLTVTIALTAVLLVLLTLVQ